MAQDEESDNKPVISLRGGANIVGCKPVFTPDAKCLLCGSGDVVKVLSVASGECVRELKGHKGRITGLQINPENQFQVLSCSQDQTIIKWDHSDGVKLKVYEFDFPLHALLTTCLPDGTLLAVRKVTHQSPELVRFTLPKQTDHRVKTKQLHKEVLDKQCSVAVGTKSEYVASVSSLKLTVCHLLKEEKKEHSVERGQQLTCVACHPVEYCVATGCKSGQILLWRSFFSSKRVVTSVIHWHALYVEDLAFTTEGSYLLSGGHECVLVKWQHNTQHKDTLPRLGAPIVGVTTSTSGTYYATCHADNVIQVISNNFKVIQIYQGLTRCQRAEKKADHPTPAGMQLDPRTHALVTNGKPGHIQFYSLHNDKQLYNLDIVCQNYISPENLQRPLVVTQIEGAAFSDDGDWLATIERRDDKETTPEMRLKFWCFDKEKQTYVLNTSVDSPHTKGAEVVKFRPQATVKSSPMVVTASCDGKFKLWTLVDDTDIYRKNMCWSCESVGFYRDMIAGDADFSEDGSVLAVSFEEVVTMWEPESNSLRETFTLSQYRESVRRVLFGRGIYCHLVVITTKNHLTVWNLLTCSALWTLKMKVSMLVRDPISSYMAAFTEKKHELFVFEPQSEKPLYHQSAVSQSAISSALFVPHQKRDRPYEGSLLTWQNQSQLYFLNEDQELLTIRRHRDVQSDAAKSQLKIAENLPETAFSRLMAQQKRSGVKVDESRLITGHQGQPQMDVLKEILQTPAHVLPPMSSLCMTFMDTLLLKNQNKAIGSDDESDDDEEEDKAEDKESQSDSDMEVDGSENIMAEKKSIHKEDDTDNALEEITQKTFGWITSGLPAECFK